MKKYLSILCILLMLTSFASCGETPTESSEIIEEVVLDSIFENDYIKIAINDDWEENAENSGKTNSIYWKWENENFSKHSIRLDVRDGMQLFNFEQDKLMDSFEENNQFYVVTGDKNYHNIFFKTNEISGKFSYSSDDEEIVMDMIKSMEFKTFEKKTEPTTRKTIKKVTKATTKPVTEPITEPPTEKPAETQPPAVETTPVQTTVHFILNLDTSCIHIDSGCSAAQKITPENYSTVDIAESDLESYNGTYWACGKCCSNSMRQKLPKF